MDGTKAFRLATLALLVGLLATGVAVLVQRSHGPGGALEIALPTPEPLRQTVVYVTGAVGQPGLYPVRDGSRVADALALAGGLAADADTSRLNLAARVADGDHVHVPRLGEPASEPPAGLSSATLVNINRATPEELQRLPGIGPARAQAIVSFREARGRFERAEDLLQIEGIGPATLERLRPLITLR